MTQEDKKLLLKDLCGRLPYRVLCKIDLAGYLEWNNNYKESFEEYAKIRENAFELIDSRQYHLYAYACTDRFELLEFESEEVGVPVEFIKPYLRPMSNMTEEESEEYRNLDNRSYSCPIEYAHIPASDRIDWLNVHHFDYRGLIVRGLALEAPKGMLYIMEQVF